MFFENSIIVCHILIGEYLFMQILKELPHLSSTELYIYNFIMTNPIEVSEMTIKELAKKTNTSTASILRLCRKYRCKGYSEFKYQLRKEALNKYVNENYELDDSLEEIRYFFEHTCNSETFLKSMEDASKLLSGKSLIIFAGMGGSNIMCEYGTLYFSYLFNLAFRIEDMFNISFDYFPEELSGQTCLIVVSSSGETSEIFSYIKNYRARGCSLITITSDENSLLGKMADISIPYHFSLKMDKENNLTSQVPVVYIIEQLAREVTKLRSANKENSGE